LLTADFAEGCVTHPNHGGEEEIIAQCIRADPVHSRGLAGRN
jgi:hypothetical protein